MKQVIILLALIGSTGSATEGEVYTKKVTNEMSKIEAMKELLVSNNKTTILKCVEVELSKKGSIKNK